MAQAVPAGGAEVSQLWFFIIFAALVLVPSALFKVWTWFWFLLAVIVLVAIAEGMSVLVQGCTLSQVMWRTDSTSAWVILGCLSVAWVALMVHLAPRSKKK
jgi:hypothetical protein